MGTTTFSGPIKAGAIKETTGTTLGSDVKNTGQVVMAQTHLIDLSAGAIAAGATTVVIPANSQIIDIVFDAVVAASANTNISIGDTVGGATSLVNLYPLTTAVGRHYPTTQSGGAAAWSDTGTADIKLTVTASAVTNAGTTRITTLYQQNNNLS